MRRVLVVGQNCPAFEVRAPYGPVEFSQIKRSPFACKPAVSMLSQLWIVSVGFRTHRRHARIEIVKARGRGIKPPSARCSRHRVRGRYSGAVRGAARVGHVAGQRA